VVNPNGTVVIDTDAPQRVGAPLGDPGDRRFAALPGGWGNAGRFTVDGRLAAYHRVEAGASNGNVWYTVALSPAPTTVWTGVGAPTIVMCTLALLLIGYAVIALRRGRSLLVAAAYTDPLTGLYNRRKLVTDLDHELARASTDDPLLLIMCDLNGFKSYNDTFGHPAGDALLARLGKALSAAVAPKGHAYRLGGDEFCVLARPGRDDVAGMISITERALSEHGDGFSITTSYGAILLPDEGSDAKAAMRLVDLRMYEQKNSGRVPADAQTTSALLRALQESDPGLAERMAHTADLADAVAQRLDLPAADRARIVQAARLHDIGKVAVPDDILSKTEPLTDAERAFLQQCPTIGERIAAAAPSLTALAPLIRASRERFDGTGYPDRLAGETIPLGARIIATCSSYAAMTSTRPHAEAIDRERAIDQIRRGCGTQFDPRVAEALLEHLATAARPRADVGRA
jgi:diguanylate cyclase (GGDEF)-like protein